MPDGPIMREIRKGTLKFVRGIDSQWRKKQEENKFIKENYFKKRPKRYPKAPTYNYANVKEDKKE